MQAFLLENDAYHYGAEVLKYVKHSAPSIRIAAQSSLWAIRDAAHLVRPMDMNHSLQKCKHFFWSMLHTHGGAEVLQNMKNTCPSL